MKKFILITILSFISVQIFSQTLEERYREHIGYLTSDKLQGRAASTLGDTLSVEYIQGVLSKMEGVTLLGDNGIQVVPYTYRRSRADTTRISATTFNVVAFIEATDPTSRKQTVILGAHYDHLGMRMVNDTLRIHPGADDNASGVAFMLENAREIAAQRDRLKTNVVIVFFGAEERGTIGSRYYADNPLKPIEEVKAMLNVDMFGRFRNGLTMRGLGTAHEAMQILGRFKNPDKIDIIYEVRGNGPTDYAAFYRKGIPAFSFSTRQHDDYHTWRDTYDKVNFPGMVTAHDYVWQLIEVLAFTNTQVRFKDVMDPHEL
jgi:Predicted aminopeptidases